MPTTSAASGDLAASAKGLLDTFAVPSTTPVSPDRVAAIPPLPPGTPPLMAPGRSAQSTRALFARGTVNGEELIAELRAMKDLMSQQRSAAAVRNLMGSLDAAPGRAGAGLQDALMSTAITTAIETTKQYAMSVSFQALDQHLATVLADPAALRAETVRLPVQPGASEAQMRRTLVMATLVVGARVTNKMLQRAEQDFKSIEGGYTDLLARREKTATVLYELMARGAAGQAELARALPASDVKFVEASVARMSVKDFSQDLAAQNLALGYLQKTDPAAFADYQAQSDRMLPAAQGYLRTVSGGVAFAGMLAVFGQEVVNTARGKQAADILARLPLAAEFAAEVPGLVPVAANAITEGVRVPFKSGQRFRAGPEGGKLVEYGSAREVFAEIERRGADPLLRQSIFRNETSGLLHKLYMCSPSEAGKLLDTAVKMDERERFAQAYLGAPQPRFSFAGHFELPPSRLGVRERDLGDDLLRGDYRQRTDPTRLPMVAVQKLVVDAGGYRTWTDDELMRLIFANREGQAQHATLQLGDTVVRPIANAQSVFAYESLVDACRRVALAEPVAAPAAAPAPAPASQRRTTRPPRPAATPAPSR